MAFGRQPCSLASCMRNLDLPTFFDLAQPMAPVPASAACSEQSVLASERTAACQGQSNIRGVLQRSLDWALGPSVQSYLIIWVFRPLGLVPGLPGRAQRPAASDWAGFGSATPGFFDSLRPFRPLASRPGDGPPNPLLPLRPIRPDAPACTQHLKEQPQPSESFFSTPIPPSSPTDQHGQRRLQRSDLLHRLP